MLSSLSSVMANLPNTARAVLPEIWSSIGALAAITAPLPTKPAKVSGSIIVDAVMSPTPDINLPRYWSLNAVSLSSWLNTSKPADKNLRLLSVQSWNQPLLSPDVRPGDRTDRAA